MLALRIPESFLSSLQFVDIGCENCPFLNMDGDSGRVTDCTTVNFTGYAELYLHISWLIILLTLLSQQVLIPFLCRMIALIDPEASWAAKWQHACRHADLRMAVAAGDLSIM